MKQFSRAASDSNSDFCPNIHRVSTIQLSSIQVSSTQVSYPSVLSKWSYPNQGWKKNVFFLIQRTWILLFFEGFNGFIRFFIINSIFKLYINV